MKILKVAISSLLASSSFAAVIPDMGTAVHLGENEPPIYFKTEYRPGENGRCSIAIPEELLKDLHFSVSFLGRSSSLDEFISDSEEHYRISETQYVVAQISLGTTRKETEQLYVEIARGDRTRKILISEVETQDIANTSCSTPTIWQGMLPGTPSDHNEQTGAEEETDSNK
jgi:hypothetical protein